MPNIFDFIELIGSSGYYLCGFLVYITVFSCCVCCQAPPKTTKHILLVAHSGIAIVLAIFIISFYGFYNFELPVLLINIIHVTDAHALMIFVSMTAQHSGHRVSIQGGQKLLGVPGNTAVLFGCLITILLFWKFPLKFPIPAKEFFYIMMVFISFWIVVIFLLFWYALRVSMATKFNIRISRKNEWPRVIGTLEWDGNQWVETMFERP